MPHSFDRPRFAEQAMFKQLHPQAEEQRCWNHRIVNLLTKLPKRVHKPALLILRQIPYAETREEAQRLKKVFQHWCR